MKIWQRLLKNGGAMSLTSKNNTREVTLKTPNVKLCFFNSALRLFGRNIHTKFVINSTKKKQSYAQDKQTLPPSPPPPPTQTVAPYISPFRATQKGNKT